MPSRGILADIMAAFLIIAGLYLIFFGPNQNSPTLIEIQGQKFSSPNLGESLAALGVFLFIATGSTGSKIRITPQRLKYLFLRGALLILALIYGGFVLTIRTEFLAILMILSVIAILILLGGFIVPRFLKIDSAMKSSKR